MSIGVIGQGFVGGSLTTVFHEHGETVYVYDKTGKVASGGQGVFYNHESQFLPKNVTEFVRSCEVISGFSDVFFVCVPTPMHEDGSCDVSIVEDVLESIASAPYNSESGDRIAVIKSTIPPGSTETWNKRFNSKGLFVIFNPEFLTEANAVNDMREQTRIVLGGPRPHINVVKNIFQRAFPKVQIVKTSSTTAEMVKYTTNCFLATKVSFANEVSQICEALDTDGLNIDYDKVVEYAKLDKRLGDTHWSVPGPVPTHDGRYVKGFGGHCVVSDTIVSTPNGNCLVQNIVPGDVITSTTYNLNDTDLKTVNEISSREYSGEIITFYLSVEDNTKQITCTPSHLFPILREGKQELCQAKDILETDELFLCEGDFLKSLNLQKIEKSIYTGTVYNLELQTNDHKNDDLFWICNGIVVHNCFPKDLNGLIHIAKSYNVKPTVMSAAWEKNLEVRSPADRDWEKMTGRAVSKRKE